MRQLFLLSMVSVAFVGCDRQEQQPKNPPLTHVTAPDNTAKNVRDLQPDAKTAFDQSEKESDLLLTQAIRQAVMEDDALSMNAKNIKIITVNGIVTLRGPVANVKEKEIIAKKLHGMQGVMSVFIDACNRRSACLS